MDEQRMQAYEALIEQLMWSDSEAETSAVLQQHHQLVNVGLLKALDQQIEQLQHRGKAQTAQRLQRIQQRVRDSATQNGGAELSLEEGDAEQFLRAVLRLVAESQGDPQQVYPFLTQHQEQLNETLLQILSHFAETLLTDNFQQRKRTAYAFNEFGDLIAQFPSDQPWLNLEISIAAYQQALIVRTREAMPVEWAQTMNQMAMVYRKRIKGDKAENFEKSIELYNQALQIRTRRDFPDQWAMIHHNLGNAYLTFVRSNDTPIEAILSSNQDQQFTDSQIQNERSKKLEKAISHYNLALEIRTHEHSPIQYARSRSSLGQVYIIRIEGDRIENLKLAISALKDALQIFQTTNNSAEEIAARSNLIGASGLLAAAAFDRFPASFQSGANSEVIEYVEQSIDILREAIRAHHRENYSHDKLSQLQDSLAIMHRYLAMLLKRGNSYSNSHGGITDSIALLNITSEERLQMFDRERSPQEWASVQADVADDYISLAIHVHLASSECMEYLEKAIQLCNNALEVYDYENFSQKWALVQWKLGIAYYLAIDLHNYGLDTGFVALGNLYRDSSDIEQERLNKLKKAERSITALQAAERFYVRENYPERWALLQNDIGLIYDRRSYIYSSTAQFDSDERSWRLFIRDWKEAIDAFNRASEILTRKKFPFDWAGIQSNLAYSFCRREGDHASNLRRAISAYQNSLEIFTPETSIFQHGRVSEELGDLYFDLATWRQSLENSEPESLTGQCEEMAGLLGNPNQPPIELWLNVASMYKQAIKAKESLYQQSIIRGSQEDELLKSSHLHSRLAYALAKAGDLQAAVVTLEQSRARSLSITLEQYQSKFQELQQLAPDLCQRYQELSAQLSALEKQHPGLHEFSATRINSSKIASVLGLQFQQESKNLTHEDLYEETLRIRQGLDQIVSQIQQIPEYADFLREPNFEQHIASAARPRVPLVYLTYASSAGCLALIVDQTGSIETIQLDVFAGDMTEFSGSLTLSNKGALHGYVTQWLLVYRQRDSNPQAWEDVLEYETAKLWKIVSPIIEYLKSRGIEQAVLIPTGLLGFLPLHAAWTADPTTPTGKRYALDEILFTYAPNARSLNAASTIARQTETDAMLAINNPLRDLPNSSREVTAAVASFPQPQILEHKDATRESVLAALPACNVLHLSCHGTANLREPLNSGLAMSDQLLTLRDLLSLKLSEQGGIRLAVLSACETGLAGIELADEAISLPTGLLQAGVAGVVASLWSVSDLSTMLLLVRFYDLWRNQNLPPAVALRQAQIWLRDSTEGELANYFGLLTPTPEKRTYAHPFHWGAFSYTGV
jgi:CHAT domain-containing protein